MTQPVELSKINLFGYTNRLVDIQKVDMFMDLINNKIIISPPTIAPYKNGYFCLDGLHRIIAFKNLSKNIIQCNIDDTHEDIRLNMLEIAKKYISELSDNCKSFQEFAIKNSYDDGLSLDIISNVLGVAQTPLNNIICQHRKAIKENKIEMGKNLIIKKGYTIKMAARELEVDYYVFRKWIKFFEELIIDKIEEKKFEIISLKIKGHNSREISDKVNIPRSYISKWISSNQHSFEELLLDNQNSFMKGEP